MLLQLPIEIIIILLPILIFSLSFHEFAHGYVAYILGDNTASYNGRLTMNPFAHLDPVGSMMILFVGFGWAKPVPINPANFSNPRTDNMKVAIAGPLSNLFLALLGGIIFRLLTNDIIYINKNIIDILYIFILINIRLAVFNMLPIYPLDGSHIFGNIISAKNPNLAYKLQKYGPNILIALILIGIFTGFSILSLLINPISNLFMYIFAGL